MARFALGLGEGGGFPGSAKAISEWFPARERSFAFGMFNTGSSVGAVIAPPLIASVILNIHWLALSSWRWVFFMTGALGLVWTAWWVKRYFPPAQLPQLATGERAGIQPAQAQPSVVPATVPLFELLRFK